MMVTINGIEFTLKDGATLKEVKAGDTVLTANDKGEYILKADKADITVTLTFDGGSSSNSTVIIVIAVVAAVVIGAAAAGIVLAKKKK